MKTKIFVTVGSTYPLDRLIKEVDKLDPKKFEIFAQIGESKLYPKNIKWKKFINYEEMQKKIKWADIILSHAGVGTIIDCLNQKKSLLLFPRLKKYGESIDNHQLEICKAFNAKFKINYFKNPNRINFKIPKKIKIQNKSILADSIKINSN
jgi:UDP-N-acetylglucosamine transferase subunit ALG13